MAFVTPTTQGRFEIRESRSTPQGPRSRTLASFTELTDEVIEKARSKANKPLTREQVVNAARRAGAPIARSAADQAARELIVALSKGEQPEPKLRQLLAAKLNDGSSEVTTPSDPARAVGEWMASTPAERGKWQGPRRPVALGGRGPS
jgi:uncharacterized protein (DUF1778 family)